MRPIHSYFENINLAKTAGINRVLVLDFQAETLHIACVERAEPWYEYRKSEYQKPAGIVAAEIIVPGGTHESVTESINQFIAKHQLKDIITIVSLNEGKLIPIAMPTDTEDPADWLGDAVQRSIPGGRVDEFCYSVAKEEFIEDSPQVYSVLLMRKQAITEVLKILSGVPVRLCAITSASLEYRAAADMPVLFFQSSGQTLHFVYHQYGKCPLQGTEYIQGSNSNKYQDAILAIRQNLHGLYPSGSVIQTIVAVDQEQNYTVFKTAINSVFTETLPDTCYKNLSPTLLSAAFAADRVLRDKDTIYNLLPTDKLQAVVSEIDRQFTNRVILTSGVFLFLLLFCIQLSEMWLQDYELDLQEKSAGVKNYSSETVRLSRDNSILKKNLEFIIGIRYANRKFTPVLAAFGSIVTSRSCLSSIQCKESNSSTVTIEINGYAINRQDVTTLIANMERQKNFSHIALTKSELMKETEIPEDVELPSEELITFTITAVYGNTTN